MRRLSPPLARALSLALLVTSSCSRSGSDPSSTPGGTQATSAATEPASSAEGGPSSGDTCRDYADLDLARLPPLPDTPYTDTLDAVWRTILLKHYDRTLGCVDWVAVRAEFGARLPEAKNEADAYAMMSAMLGRLGQSHMAIVPPREPVAGEPRAAVKGGSARAPVAVRVLGTEAVVVDAEIDGHRSGIPLGARVLTIDGQAVQPLVDERLANHPRAVEGTFAVRRVLEGWLSCPENGRKTIEYQAVGAAKPKVRKVKCYPVEAERVSLGHLKDVPVTVDHRMIEGTTIGYLSFNIWMIPMMARIEAALTELRADGMTALVIDLRGNPGGVGAMVVPLGRLILSEAASLGVMHMRDSEQAFNVAAGRDPFTGPIALLVDEGTASTSEIFAQALQDLDRVKVYGAVPSQGAALPSVIEELPGGGILQFVVADYQSPSGTAVEGKGVTPDVVVPETREDYARGHDPVLEAAVADLGGS